MKIRVDTPSEVSQVRQRYMEALERGMGHEAATKYANGSVVAVKGANGPRNINARFYDPKRHQLAEPRPDAPSVPETAYLPTAEPRADQEAVEIPDNWRELSWPQRKSLASRVSDAPIINSGDAEAAIELEIERRQGG